MVNKCCIIGCRTPKKEMNNVKFHRFPLTNLIVLPLWIIATGMKNDWKPRQRSRICSKHFKKTAYQIGHGEGVLKETAIPTMDCHKYVEINSEKKSLNSSSDVGHPTKDKPVASDTNVEIINLGYNDVYNLKYEHQSKDKHDDRGESYDKNEYKKIENNKKCTNECEHHNFFNLENGHGETLENAQEDFNYKTINDICNRKNQCYILASSFFKGNEPIVLTHPDYPPSDGSSILNIDRSTSNTNFNKITGLKSKKQRFTKNICSLNLNNLKKKEISKQEKYMYPFGSDLTAFVAFLESQLEELKPYKKIYLSTKYMIKKILMKAQLKISMQ